MAQLSLTTRDRHRLYAAVLLLDGVFIVATLGQGLGVKSGLGLLDWNLHLGHEANLATWFSSALFLVGGLVALLNARGAGARGAAEHLRRVGWVGLAAFLLVLSADEVAGVHEWLGHGLVKALGHSAHLGTERNPAFGWLLYLSPLVAILLLGMVWFFWRGLRGQGRTRWLALAGLALWVGAIGCEYVGTQLVKRGMPQDIEEAIEEGLELLGGTLLLIAFVEYGRTPSTAQGPCG